MKYGAVGTAYTSGAKYMTKDFIQYQPQRQSAAAESFRRHRRLG